MSALKLAVEVRDAIASGRPVVALESTIFSRLGLPGEHGRRALEGCLAAIRERGAVPAVTAVLDGVARVGVAQAELERILAADRKCAARDLPVAVAQGWEVGATTVSASLTLAARVGIGVFATGGIGGVHRDVLDTFDVSADLHTIARLPVVTVAAGAKSFLDIPRTLEHLETLGVPVLGLGTDTFPAFYARSSGHPVQVRVETPAEAAAVVVASRHLGHGGGVLLAVPVDDAFALDPDELDRAVADALSDAAASGVTGGAVTPFVLERLAHATGGRSVHANVALAVADAAVAAALAAALLP